MVLRILRDVLVVCLLYGVCAVFFPHELGGVFDWAHHAWTNVTSFISGGIHTKGPGQ
jgi:hypothetical protein